MEKIPELDTAGLRKFALTLAVIVSLLFGVFFPWLFNLNVPIWPWVFSLAALCWCLCAPVSFRVIYRVWMAFGQMMNRITNFILLGIIYYLVITPMGFILRNGKNTQIKLEIDEAVSSYRVSSDLQHRDNMKRPF